MSAETSKLRAVQERLVEQGVRDVKFFFENGVERHSLNEMKDHLAAVLTSYCEGKFLPHRQVGDRAHFAVAGI